MSARKPTSSRPWFWVPTLYFAEGLPYVLANSVSVVLYKNLGLPNRDIAFYTSWFYLPWVLKPLWSPVVDLLKTRRQWIWAMQLILGAAFAGVALTVPTTHFFQATLVFFWLLAFSSATHDIAADGFYLLANTEQDQAFFVGIRNTSYRLANMSAQGGMVMLVGTIFSHTGNYAHAWSLAFGAAAWLLVCFGIYHFLVLPKPRADKPGGNPQAPGANTNSSSHSFLTEFFLTFGSFFEKPRIITLLLFLVLYRLGEAQLMKMVAPFLLDARSAGGLGLNNQQVGFAYGTVGVASLVCGGLLGGFVVSQQGLKFWLWPMLLAIHLPDAVFIWLAYTQPLNLHLIAAGIAVEQFGYGFGFTAFMIYMIYIARGKHPTAHYAICTGFMALGMMVPGAWSGGLQERLGYFHFFLWVVCATVPSFIVASQLPLEPEFGRRKNSSPV